MSKVLLLCLALASAAFADTWTTFPTPGTGGYTTFTTNFGGGDGSGATITSLGPFSFSVGMTEDAVPGSWGTWNCPPATESCTPNVLFTGAGTNTLTMTTSDVQNTLGFELEPLFFKVETISAVFNSSTGDSFTLTLPVNGQAGALLFAVQDHTLGAHITSVDITDSTAGADGFAIAQLRSGNSPATIPEPGSLALLASGLLGIVGSLRKRLIG